MVCRPLWAMTTSVTSPINTAYCLRACWIVESYSTTCHKSQGHVASKVKRRVAGRKLNICYVVVRWTMPARGRYNGRRKKRKTHEPVWTHDSNTRQERNDLPTHNPIQQQYISTRAVQQYYTAVQQWNPRSDPPTHHDIVIQQYSKGLKSTR